MAMKNISGIETWCECVEKKRLALSVIGAEISMGMAPLTCDMNLDIRSENVSTYLLSIIISFNILCYVVLLHKLYSIFLLL